MKTNDYEKLAVAVITLLLFPLVVPIIIFFGWVIGCFVKVFCGQFVTDGLNTLFGTTRFTPDSIPIIGGVLGFIGSFFKTRQINSNKEDK